MTSKKVKILLSVSLSLVSLFTLAGNVQAFVLLGASSIRRHRRRLLNEKLKLKIYNYEK
jgi:hypothetical protein